MALDKTQIEMVRAKFATEWQHDWEQQYERVAPYTTRIAEPKGVYYEVPYVGGTEVKEYSGSRVQMENSSLMHGKRGMKYRKFYNCIDISIDEVDDMMNLEYNFGLIKSKQKPAVARALDMFSLGVIKDKTTGLYRVKTAADGGHMGGILGTNYGGDDGATLYNLDTTYASFKSGKGNLVPVDYAITGAGVSANFGGTIYARIEYIKRRLAELDAFDSTAQGDICVGISPAEKQLLSAYEVGLNRDYGFGKLNETGATYNEHLNVTFLVTNMLPTMNTEDKNGTAVNNCRMCCAWLKSQIGFGMWKDADWTLKDVNGMVDVDHELRVRGKAGCMRYRDDAVFVMPVAQDF